MREHHRSRSARNPVHRVMLGDPEAVAPDALGGARQFGGGGEGFGERAALAHGDKIEHGKSGHAGGSCSSVAGAGVSAGGGPSWAR